MDIWSELKKLKLSSMQRQNKITLLFLIPSISAEKYNVRVSKSIRNKYRKSSHYTPKLRLLLSSPILVKVSQCHGLWTQVTRKPSHLTWSAFHLVILPFGWLSSSFLCVATVLIPSRLACVLQKPSNFCDLVSKSNTVLPELLIVRCHSPVQNLPMIPLCLRNKPQVPEHGRIWRQLTLPSSFRNCHPPAAPVPSGLTVPSTPVVAWLLGEAPPHPTLLCTPTAQSLHPPAQVTSSVHLSPRQSDLKARAPCWSLCPECSAHRT